MEGGISTSKSGGFSWLQIFLIIAAVIGGMLIYGMFTKQTYYDASGSVNGATKTTPSMPTKNPGTEATRQQQNKSTRRGGR